MSPVLDQAILRARSLSPADQSLVGGLILAFTDEQSRSYRLSASQIEEVKLTQQEVRDGKIATDTDMSALWDAFAV